MHLSSMATRNSDTSIFWDSIVDNREICNGCYRKIRSVIPKPPESCLRSETLKMIVTETVTPCGEGEVFWTPPKTGKYGSFISASRPQIVCGACGVIDGCSDPKPLNAVVDDARRIIDHLNEAGYELDWDVYFNTIRELKSCQYNTGNDRDILARAVDKSIILNNDK